MDKKQIYQNADIPEEWWPDCYITDDGMIFTPRFDDSGQMMATGREAYDEWVVAQADVPTHTE